MQKIKIEKIGNKSAYFQDAFYWIIKSSWPQFLIMAMTSYLIINCFFASLYYFLGAEILNTSPDSFWDSFIFSFQTSSTLGFGHYLPKSDLAHGLVILDTFSGIFYVAIITGLAYAKFAKPSARVNFSDKVILTTFDHIPTIMFRMANARDTHIVDVNLNVAALLPYTSKEGDELRKFYPLNLITSNNPTFSLSWTAMHQIDENSPLYGMDIDKIKEKSTIIFVSLTGIDDVLSQSVHSSYRYTSNDIVKARKFVDILSFANNKYTLDLTKFHDVVS
ncbi:MAG: inward rectifier potassium channel [Bacteriovoracaceae bacterium]|jgi:inward rectifier potassium channel